MSEAFKLLEDGEILMDGKVFYKFSNDGMFMQSYDFTRWTQLDMYFALMDIKKFYKYEKPKEKVQYYFAMAKWPDGSIGVLRRLTTDKETAEKLSGLEIVQLVPFGGPI